MALKSGIYKVCWIDGDTASYIHHGQRTTWRIRRKLWMVNAKQKPVSSGWSALWYECPGWPAHESSFRKMTLKMSKYWVQNTAPISTYPSIFCATDPVERCGGPGDCPRMQKAGMAIHCRAYILSHSHMWSQAKVEGDLETPINPTVCFWTMGGNWGT